MRFSGGYIHWTIAKNLHGRAPLVDIGSLLPKLLGSGTWGARPSGCAGSLPARRAPISAMEAAADTLPIRLSAGPRRLLDIKEAFAG